MTTEPDEYWDPQDPGLPEWRPELNEAPVEVRRLLLTKRESGKGPPPKLFGRTVDMQKIKEHVAATLSDDKPDQRPTGMTIRAAPGAGKTSLIQHAQKELAADGIGVVELHTGAFENAATFSAAVRKVPPWSKIDADRSLMEKITDGTADIVDAVASAWGSYEMQKHMPEVGSVHVQPARAAVAAWRAGKVPELPDVLHLLNTTPARGMFLFVDEAQRLRDVAGPNPKTSFAADAIGRLADPGMREPAGMPHVNVVLAGLNDLRPTVDQFGTYRMNHERLSPVSQATVREIIADAINNAGTAGEVTDRAQEEWRERLVNEFGDWTHHARSAGIAAQQLLEVAGEQALTEGWGLVALEYLAQRYRNTIYSTITGNAAKGGVSQNVANAIAQALVRNNGEAETLRLEGLIIRTLRREAAIKGLAPDDSKLESAAEEAMRELLRSGVLEEISPEEHPHGRAVHVFGVPSLGRHMTRHTAPNMAEIMEDLAAVGLRGDDPPG